MNAIALTRLAARRLPRLELPALLVAALLVTPLCAAAGEDACALHHDGNEGPGVAGAAATAPATATATATPMPADCPLHAAHAAHAAPTNPGSAAAAHRHEVDARGDEAMGFSQQATAHHFRLAADGGAIEVTARDAADANTTAAVRRHLRQIAVAFAAGDFGIPTAVHAQLPPGAAAMRAAGEAVRYRYEELPAGGRVVITTSTPSALAAVHDFLRFQIVDHGTGDPQPADR